MRKLLVIALLLMFISSASSKTVQCVREYDAWEYYYDFGNKYKRAITPRLEAMLSDGWKIKSITPIAGQGLGATSYVIVVFERDAEGEEND